MAAKITNDGAGGGASSADRQGSTFLKLLDETTSQLQTRVREYQEFLDAYEQKSSASTSVTNSQQQQSIESNGIINNVPHQNHQGGDQVDFSSPEVLLSEDVKGKIRSAIGKANLLVNKKFEQFRELCQKNLNEDETASFRTLNEDLAGFWDLVSIQVSDVRETFTEIDQLKKNNWQPTKDHISEIVNKKNIEPQSTSSNSSSSAATNGATSSTKLITKTAATSTNISAKLDEERRKRLQEAKQRAAQLKASQAAGDTQPDGSVIFIASKPQTSIANQ